MEFKVRTKKLKTSSQTIRCSNQQIKSAQAKIDSAIKNLDVGSGTSDIKSSLRNTSNRLSFLSGVSATAFRNLAAISTQYERTEASIFNKKKSKKNLQEYKKMKIAIEKAKKTVRDVFKKGKNAYNKYVGDPVNLDNGNFIYENCDLRIEGLEPFEFRRLYNSISDETGLFGKGWNHNYEISLNLGLEDASISWDDGKSIVFSVKQGEFSLLSGGTSNLKRAEDRYILETGEGLYIFDDSGRFIRFENDNGVGYSLEYDNGLLKKIVNDGGEWFELSYDADNAFIESISDHTGRSVEYNYRASELSKVVFGEQTTVYEYDNLGRIVGIINPNGIRILRNEYDSHDRVTCQKYPDGSEMRYTYDDDDNATILYERNGTESYHYHDELSRNTYNIYGDGSESYEYNEKNQIVYECDRNGNETKYQYDDRGNVSRITMANGSVVNITYERHNEPATISLNGERKQKNVYDDNGNLIETEDALGRRVSMKYNENGQMIEVRSPSGNTTFISYDERNNITDIIDDQGVRYKYEYDDLNRVVLSTEGSSKTMQYSYDMYGNMVSITDAIGNTRSYKYNKLNKVIEMVDFNGAITRLDYNNLGFPCSMTDPLGHITEVKYDKMWNETEERLPNGGVRRVEYNENNRVEKEIDALGNETSYTYDGNGNVTSKLDAEGGLTEYRYDELDNLIHVTDPEGNTTEYKYDERGNLICVINANGGEVKLEYDEVNQLIKETDSLGQSRKYSYTADGDIALVVDEAGRQTRFEYVSQGKLSKISYPDGREENITYDESGNVSSRSNKQGFEMKYLYDELDRVIEASGNNGEHYIYTYDEVGNLTSAADADGNVSRYEYNLNGQLVSVTDECDSRTEYDYDELGLLVGIRRIGDAEEHCTEYVRDQAGNVIKTIDPLGHIEEFAYSKTGDLIKKIDKDGYLTEFGYDLNGNLSSVKYADGKEVMMSHDALGKLAEIRDWTGVTKVESDILGRVTKVIYPDNRSAEYSYGSAGERTGIKHPDGRFVSYGYDDALRLTSLKEGDTDITYDYDMFGRMVAKTFADGLVTKYTYDNKDQLTSVNSSYSDRLIDSVKLEYDAYGNRVSAEKIREGLSEESGLFEYEYDASYRLTGVSKDGSVLRKYSYDAFGNRQTLESAEGITHYKYDAMDRLLEVTGTGSETFKYDKRGNVIERIADGESSHTYVYGAMNRLESASSKIGTASYEYNGLGHRVEDRLRFGTQSERKINYTLDLTKYYNNLLERSVNGESDAFIWDGTPVALKGRERFDFVCDDMGSPLRLVGMDGTNAETYGYNEFGVSLFDEEGYQPLRYTGYREDPIADMYFAQAREYMPEHGRMAGQDPIKGEIANPITLNPYIYAGCNPYVYYDPNGMWIHIAIGAAVGAVVDGGFELGKQLVGQVASGKGVDFGAVNWGKVTTSAMGGAVEGGVMAATGNPYAAAAAGGFLSGFAEAKFVDKKSTKDALLTGAVEGGMSAAFAKAGDMFKDSKLGKRLADCKLNSKVDGFFKKYKDTYKTLIGENGRKQFAKLMQNGGPGKLIAGVLVGGMYSKTSSLLKPMKWIEDWTKGALKCGLTSSGSSEATLKGLTFGVSASF